MRPALQQHAGSIAASVAWALLAASPAAADWQYTRWGMSPAAVKAASGGAAVDNRDRKLDAEGVKAWLTAPFQGATMPFTAVFLFDATENLQNVTLNPVDGGSCPTIRRALDATYGKPQSDQQVKLGRTVRWNDFNNDNVVVFLDLGEGNCAIQYSKLKNTRNDGTL